LINPTDPVSLGLCSQIDLDNIVNIAAEKKAKRDAAAGINNDGDSLKPVDETVPSEQPDTQKTHTLESLFKPQTEN